MIKKSFTPHSKRTTLLKRTTLFLSLFIILSFSVSASLFEPNNKMVWINSGTTSRTNFSADTCSLGNYSYYNGSKFLCSPDLNTGVVSGWEGNYSNYTSTISWLNTTKLQNGSSSNHTTIYVQNLIINGSAPLLFESGLGNGTLTGGGTSGYIPVWNDTTSINNSVMFQNGTSIGIGSTSPFGIFGVYSPAWSSIMFTLIDKTTNTPLFLINQGGSGNANALFYAINGQNPVGFTSATPAFFLNGMAIGNRNAGLAPSSQTAKTLNVVGTGIENIVPITFGTEVLTDGDFSDSVNNWTLTSGGDCSFVSGGIQCNYGSGTTTSITQNSANFTTAIKANTWYRLNLTIKNATSANSGAGYATATINTPSGTQDSSIELYNRTGVVYFKTRTGTMSGFTLTTTMSSGQRFFITNLSLTEITSGGIYTGGGATGITIMPNGAVGINNTNPTQTLDVNGSVNITGTIYGYGGNNTMILPNLKKIDGTTSCSNGDALKWETGGRIYCG